MIVVGRVMWAGYKGLRDQWERYPPEAKRRGRIAGWVAAAFCLVLGVFMMAAPLADRTKFLVLGAVMAAGIVVSNVLTAIGAVRESRAANERRRGHSASGR